MKVMYKTLDGRMQVEFDANNQVDLFEQIAAFQEIFENTECCTKDGKKRTNKVNFVVRENEGNKFYELRCVDPDPTLRFAKKQFGRHKTTPTLFPKGGWVKWNGEAEVEI